MKLILTLLENKSSDLFTHSQYFRRAVYLSITFLSDAKIDKIYSFSNKFDILVLRHLEKINKINKQTSSYPAQKSINKIF